MIARDVMTTPVLTVTPDASVREVAELMARHRVTGVVVVDPDGRAIGVVGEGDLLYRVARPHVPPHVELLGSVIYLQTPGRMDEELRRVGGATAGDLMSGRVVAVAEDTPVEDVARLMIDKKVRRVPVVQDGRPVGIVTRGDIVRHAILGAVQRRHEEEAATAPPQSQDMSGVSSSEI